MGEDTTDTGHRSTAGGNIRADMVVDTGRACMQKVDTIQDTMKVEGLHSAGTDTLKEVDIQQAGIGVVDTEPGTGAAGMGKGGTRLHESDTEDEVDSINQANNILIHLKITVIN